MCTDALPPSLQRCSKHIHQLLTKELRAYIIAVSFHFISLNSSSEDSYRSKHILSGVEASTQGSPCNSNSTQPVSRWQFWRLVWQPFSFIGTTPIVAARYVYKDMIFSLMLKLVAIGCRSHRNTPRTPQPSMISAPSNNNVSKASSLAYGTHDRLYGC